MLIHHHKIRINKIKDIGIAAQVSLYYTISLKTTAVRENMDSSQEKVKRIISVLKNNCISNVSKVTIDGCGRIFDGYYCWPETESGKLAVQACTNKDLISVNKARFIFYLLFLFINSLGAFYI